MNRSTLVKIGVATAALATAKIAWAAWLSRPMHTTNRLPVSKSTSAGQPADAFSTHAVQHDLSVGEGA